MAQGFTGATTAAAAFTHADAEVPAGARPTATLTVAHTPIAGSLQLFLNGVMLQKVGAAPTSGQYTLTGTTIVAWRAITSTDNLLAYYRY